MATSTIGGSLVAVIAQAFYVFEISDTLAVMGTASTILPLLIIVIAMVLVWVSTRASRKDWIG